MTTTVDLYPFCLHEPSRYSLEKPWRLPDGRVAATDARILVVLDDGSGFDEPAGKVPDVVKALKHFGEAAEWLPYPEIKGPPRGADDEWNTGQVCSECDGAGYEECSQCGHEEECSHCDGDGRVNGVWWYDRDEGERYMNVGNMTFDRRYLWLFTLFENVVWQEETLNGSPNALNVKFDGGIGVLMPVDLDRK